MSGVRPTIFLHTDEPPELKLRIDSGGTIVFSVHFGGIEALHIFLPGEHALAFHRQLHNVAHTCLAIAEEKGKSDAQ